MVNHTRLDCVLGSAGLMRQAAAQALHHARHRAAFGRLLVEQPLMKSVLADLWLESEAALQLSVRLAAAYEGQDAGDPHRPLRRIATALAKYWVCKRAPGHIAEALECLGGNGFIEEAPLARLYREAPLNSIWEGSGNVICLDVLRAMHRDPGCVDALLAEVAPVAADEPAVARELDAIKSELSQPDSLEPRARRLTERLALTLQAALLRKHAPTPIADAFMVARLGPDRSPIYGALPGGIDLDLLIDRATPVMASVAS
jgi:putative acyl-CoA dehydrogenase